jgi:hypothetical protein
MGWMVGGGMAVREWFQMPVPDFYRDGISVVFQDGTNASIGVFGNYV